MIKKDILLRRPTKNPDPKIKWKHESESQVYYEIYYLVQLMNIDGVFIY